MSEEVRRMFAGIADRYDTGNTVLSLGIHHLWRRKTVRASIAAPGLDVLDCATGTGDLALEFKKAVGADGQVVGTDFCADMLDLAPDKAERRGLDVRFELADAMNLQYADDSFDIASIAFGIRNVDDPAVCLRELARVVKPGGQVVVLEFGQPEGVLALPYRLYARYLLPTLGALVTGQKAAYNYLHSSSARFPCREEFIGLMNETGAYANASFQALSFGIAYLYLGTVGE